MAAASRLPPRAAGRLSHALIALVDENTPSVFIVPRCGVYDKVVANVEEIKARGGPAPVPVAPALDDLALWSRSQTGVAPLKRKR